MHAVSKAGDAMRQQGPSASGHIATCGARTCSIFDDTKLSFPARSGTILSRCGTYAVTARRAPGATTYQVPERPCG